jgi:hypothetical protein
MNLIEKTQTSSYHDNYTNSYIAKGGYLISDLIDYKSLEMEGGGVGFKSTRDFFEDLSIPPGLFVHNKPNSIGERTKVSSKIDIISNAGFNQLLETVFLSKPRNTTRKVLEEKRVFNKTRKTHIKNT